jgi:hypothetical protein
MPWKSNVETHKRDDSSFEPKAKKVKLVEETVCTACGQKTKKKKKKKASLPPA